MVDYVYSGLSVQIFWEITGPNGSVTQSIFILTICQFGDRMILLFHPCIMMDMILYRQ